MQKQKQVQTTKILVTPDKFRGSLNATQICQTIQQAFDELKNQNIGDQKKLKVKVIKLQLADGGQGSLEILFKKLKNLQKVQITCKDPLFRPIKAYYLVDKLNNIAYVQMAKTSGLNLLQIQERNPLKTTTFGVGEIISDIINKKIHKIYLFIGGSATNDAGIGMAAALGYKFIDINGIQLSPIGENLINISKIQHPPKQKIQQIVRIDISVVSDVQNVFFGLNGAAYVYGPQKGGDQKAVQHLDKGLKNLNQIFIQKFNRNLQAEKGSGAGGGISGGAIIFLNAKLKKGIEKIMQIIQYDKLIEQCGIVITGEGKVDRQSLQGKVVFGVLNKANKYKKPLWIICGINQLNAQDLQLIYKNVRVISLVDDKINEEEAKLNCKKLIKIKIKDEYKKYLLEKQQK